MFNLVAIAFSLAEFLKVERLKDWTLERSNLQKGKNFLFILCQGNIKPLLLAILSMWSFKYLVKTNYWA